MRPFRRLSAAVLVVASTLVAQARPAAAADAEGRTTHTVYAGQTLGKIAKRYKVSVDDLCRVNGLRHGSRIHPGQKLIVPDDDAPLSPPKAHAGPSKWQDYAQKPKKKGFIVLDTPTKHWRGFVLTKRGHVLPRSQEAIEKMFASWRTGVRHDIDPRLIKLVVQVSDTFGGRPLRVVSGYREVSFAVESKHKVGRAFDFSIPGVPNAALKDYLRTLPSVGVGYYPNSTHVHLDVREATTYWVDHAGPGEPPKYANRGAPTDLSPSSVLEEAIQASVEKESEGEGEPPAAPSPPEPSAATN